MHRLLWQSQLWIRIPPLKPAKMMEKSFFHVCVQNANCSTKPAELDYKKYKIKRALYGVQSPLKLHYNVDYSEVVALLAYQLKDLKRISKTQLNELLLLLKEKEYEWDDIRKDKEILLVHPGEIRDRLHLFDEFGVAHPRLHDVTHIRLYLQRSIDILRQHDIFGENFDPLHHVLRKTKNLELPQETLSKIKDHFKNIDEFSLADIHIYFLVHYFAKRFRVDIRDAKLAVEGHRLPTWKPLTAYIKICDTVIDTLEMDFADVLRHPKLLNINPINALKTIGKYEAIGGTPTVDLIKDFPQLLVIPHSRLSKWIALLENQKVNRFVMNSEAMSMFKSNNFKEVKERLQVLQRLPEYEAIQMSKKFFELLKDPFALKKLLEAVHSGTPFSSLSSVLGHPPSSTTQGPRMMTMDMKIYVAQKLGLNENKPEDLAFLNEVRTNLGLANIHLVLNLLLNFGFSKEQVINGIQILSFEHSILKAALEEFPTMPETQPFDEWMGNPYVIHLLAYVIKRNTSHQW